MAFDPFSILPSILSLGRELLSWLRTGRRTPSIPRKTLVIIPKRDFWWHMGRERGEPSMQIVGDLTLTNTSEDFVSIPRVRLKAFATWIGIICRTRLVDGRVSIENPYEDGPWNSTTLYPKVATGCRAIWWIQPPILKAGKTLEGKVCITDQFGNEHWTKMISWRYHA